MSDYTVRLLHREAVAEGTMAFHLEKPQDFQFKAGQSIDLSLIDPPETDAEGNTRAFSLATAPHEPELMVATRMRDSAYKRVLRDLPIGTELGLAGPFGSFTLHNKAERPAVFLVGGIGITPFRSMLRHAAHERLPHRLYMFYSNNRPEDAAFLDEMKELEEANPHYRLVATMTAMERSQRAWEGCTGFIDAEMLKKVLKDLYGPIYYMAGPPAMVKAMREMLNQAGVDDDDIRSEEFAGY